MRVLISFTILLLSMLSGKFFDDRAQLYMLALKRHVLMREAAISTERGKKEFARKPIFVINQCEIELPNQLGGHKLQALGDSTDALKNDSDGLSAIKLNPISVDHGNIILVLSDYTVRKDNNRIKFAYAGGMEYVFNYDSKNRRYSIVRTKVISF